MLTKEIQNVLKSKKSAHKNNAKLYYHLLKSMKIDPNGMTAAEMLNKMSKKELPSFDSVSTTARAIRNNRLKQ